MIIHSKMVNALWKIHQGNKNVFFADGNDFFYFKLKLFIQTKKQIKYN
jgi:prepilin-type processing-associated H-X9-DG protein